IWISFKKYASHLDGSENRSGVFLLSDTNTKFFRPVIRKPITPEFLGQNYERYTKLYHEIFNIR
ncbi:MAG: hypothetical protein ACXWWP_12550, partial [Candidatus Binatia bacterium]